MVKSLLFDETINSFVNCAASHALPLKWKWKCNSLQVSWKRPHVCFPTERVLGEDVWTSYRKPAMILQLCGQKKLH